jgi:EAL domain-containing protein (putative c-di-GMP-specific phosphodiesterase class I)
VAAYWVALLAGVHTPLVARWGLIVLLAAPAVLILGRAAKHRERRFAWAALGAGLLSTAFGWVLQPQATPLPAPGIADVFWLAMYPCVLATFAALARPWLRRAPRKLALDAAAIMLAAAAVAMALALPAAVESPDHLTLAEEVVSFAYPAADCILLTVALIGAAVAGWRAGPAWGLLALGIVALVSGDILWAKQAADGTWQPIMDSNAIYPVWAWIAAAAVFTRRDSRTITPSVVRTHVAALVAAVAALALLVANEWIDVPAVSIVMAGFALLLAIHRTGLALAQSVRESFSAARERELVDDVRDALAAGELELHYQPLVDARTGVVKGAEALLRWSRDGVNVPPDDFLPAVERSDLMAPLTDYVLDRALAQAATWGGIGISVNLATANLSEPDLPARVIAALRRHGVPPSRLTLEITETAAVADSVMADHVLAALDTAGVALSVDDFGTGHSSIVRIARFPICEVKIDRCFVREMHTSKRPIVATTIELAHALGLRVVAEGIEDQETLLALRELGCDIAQGYHVSRPLTAAAFAGWLAVGRADLQTTSAATEVAAPLSPAGLRAV